MTRFHSAPIVIETAATPPETTVPAFKKLLASAVKYGEARAKLLALEAKIAARGLKTGLLLYGVAAVLAIAGAAVLIAGLVLLLAFWLPQANGALACGIVAAVLFLTAFLLSRRGRGVIRNQHAFPASRAEFESDKQCLKNL